MRSGVLAALLAASASLFFGISLGQDSARQPPAEPSPQALPLSGAQGRVLEALRSGRLGEAAEFTARARVAFRTEGRAMTAEAAVLSLPGPGALSSSEGWRADGRVFSWTANSQREPAAVNLPLGLPSTNSQSAGFDELWLEYRPVPGMTECLPGFELQLGSTAGIDATGETLAVGGAVAMKVVSRIDVLAATWREKDAGYLMGRIAGFRHDDDWRYAQHDAGRAVLQRRLDMPLEGIDLIDIGLASATSIEHVNLRIGAGADSRLLSFPNAGETTLPDGRPGMRIALREALQAHFAAALAGNRQDPGKHRLALQEIVIFVPGNALSHVRGDTLLDISFQGPRASVADARATVKRLESRMVPAGAGRQRLVVDLRALAQPTVPPLRQAHLRLAAPARASACAVVVDGISAVTPFTGTVPLYAAVMEKWARRWNDVETFDRDKAQSPGLIGYLPFAALSPSSISPSAVDAASDGGRETNQAPPPAAPFRILDRVPGKAAAPDRSLVSAAGVTLSAVGRLPNVARDGSLLVVQGRSQALELAWPIAGRVAETMLFQLNMLEGADQVASAELFLELGDGRTLHRRITPNKSHAETIGPAEVRKLRLRLVPAVHPFKFKLLDAALVEPRAVTFAEAFTTALPTKQTLVPTPVIVEGTGPTVVEAKAGSIRGVSGAQPLQFTTQLDPALDWPYALRLQYRLSASYLDEDGCPLTLELEWAHGRSERQVCLDKSESAIEIPVASLLGRGATPPPGALRSVTWKLRPPRRDTGTFRIDFAFEGEAMISAADQLRLLPLVYAASNPVFADPREVARIAGQAPRVWLTLPSGFLESVMKRGADVQPAAHPLFAVDSVVAEPRTPLAADPWRAATEPPKAVGAPRWQKWAVLALVVLVLWALTRAATWSFVRRGGSAAWRPLAATGRLVAAGGARLAPVGRIAHGFVGLAAVGGCAWLAGRLGAAFGGAMALATAVMLAWGVYAAWRGPEGRTRLLPVIALSLIGAILAASWGIGRYGFALEVGWAGLPLLGGLFVMLPELPRRTLHVVRHHSPYLVALATMALTAALYLVGSLLQVSTSENYLYTFAALVAAFALRSVLRLGEPTARDIMPAVAGRVYGSAGGVYFVAALVSLAATGVALGLKGQAIAEQIAVVMFFSLAIGVVKELSSRRHGAADSPGTDGVR